MSDKIELIIKNSSDFKENSYIGFKEITVNRSMFTISNSFTFPVSEDWIDFTERKIRLGADARVVVNGKTIVNGYIDETPISYDSNTFNVSYNGRDATGDFVDCSANIDEAENELDNPSPHTILKKLLEQFETTPNFPSLLASNINLRTSLSYVTPSIEKTFKLEKYGKFAITPASTVLENIQKICEKYAVLAYTDGAGLVIGGASTKPIGRLDVLESGKNILAVKSIQSNRKRYSHYYVKGRAKDGVGQESSKIIGESKEKASGSSSDLDTVRFRPLVISAPNLDTAAKCKKRADWVKDNMIAQSRIFEVTVQGWTKPNGDPWMLNEYVKFKDTHIGVEGDLLITSIVNRLTETDGSISILSLSTPKFLILPGGIQINTGGTSNMDSFNEFYSKNET